jgi:hypothetical protein
VTDRPVDAPRYFILQAIDSNLKVPVLEAKFCV